MAVTRSIAPDWPYHPRAVAAARDAERAEQALQDAARDTAEQPVVESLGAPIDDFEEATEADALPVDEETTRLRPPPIQPELVLQKAATVSPATRDRPVPARGRIGKYELFTRLARGAFGVVYTAHDPNLDRSVAIKVLRMPHWTNPEIVQRFLQEARATARIVHPGIVTIHDFGMVETRRGSTAFIAMELLSGESLARRLAREGRLDPSAACEIVRQVASALEAAHHVDVLHRDLKPDNIFLVPDPAMPTGERVKVLDFGLAKLGASGQTQAELVFGTPRYISPEQSRSATQIDGRSDIYSLGCVLFELVTGRTPFDGDPRQLIERHQRATPPRAAALAPPGGVCPVLDELIADMLAKDPRDRPQTMAAVQRVLRFAADGGTHERPTAPQDPPERVLALLAGAPSSRAGSPSSRAGSPAAARISRPSSPAMPRRPSPPDPAGPSSGVALHSVEISMSSFPWHPAVEPAPARAGVRGASGEPSSEALSGASVPGDALPGEAVSPETLSGEIVVPADAARQAEHCAPAPLVDWPAAPDRRQRLVFYLCVVTAAVVTAAALAVA